MAFVRRILPCIAALACLVAAPAASASTLVYGSDLKAPANMVEGHGADSAFWMAKYANGGPVAAPFDGQVTSVRVKGNVLEDPSGRMHPTTMFHFQTLRRLPDGEVAVWLSSGAFFTPLGGDSEVISTYRPINMCVHKGDILDFNDIGGNQWHWAPYHGMPFQVFSRVEGSTMNFYTKNAGTNIGDHWKPAEVHQGEELLMQMTLATGPDATWICPGGYAQHVHKGVYFKRGPVQLSGNTAKVRITCPWPTYGNCRGSMTGSVKIGTRQLRLGKGGFNVLHGWSTWVYVPLPGAAVKAAQRGGVKVRFTATSHDDPNADKRNRWPRITPVQTAVNSANITVTP